MGTIFVAYGEPDHRTTVLEFAARQAAASGFDLLVYHVQESTDEALEELQDEVDTVLERVAPDVAYEVQIDTQEQHSDRTNVSSQKRLTDAILDAEQEYEYVVMGEIERDSIESFTHASMTEAVLETHAVPVLLVPVG